jgi:glycosyltransferase involved in cell wall biosynthesis
MSWSGVWTYPGEDWNRCVYQWSAHHEADLVITLMDVWPLDHEIFAEIEKTRRLASWVPVDHKPVPPPVAAFFHATNATPIAMSKFGEQELHEAGLDPLYIPHGVETDVFIPKDRQSIRDDFGIPQDAFVVGMVANNQGTSPSRKAFSECFLAFSIFRNAHPGAILYLHCEMTGFRNGLDLWRMASRFDIPIESMRVSHTVLMENGVPPQVMADIYNSMDVLLNPSYGEGFGVPLIEAQACGIPVIVTDWTAMPELCFSGWTVGGTPWDHPMAEASWMQPDVGQIVSALEAAYESRGDEQMAAAARFGAMRYDADHILEAYWKPALEKLLAPREVPPLPNRKMRRAAKAAA